MKRFLVPVLAVGVPLLAGVALVLVLTLRSGPRVVEKPGYAMSTTESSARTATARVEVAEKPKEEDWPPRPGQFIVYKGWPFDAREAKRRQEETARALGVKVEEEVNVGGGVTLTLVLIPAGQFTMGSPRNEAHRDDDEDQRQVTISRPFWVGKYEVTREQWEAVAWYNPSSFSGAKYPIGVVSWKEIQGFLQKLNAWARGGEFGLPTEAQWEYACRAGTATPFHFGETITTEQANYGRRPEYRESSIAVGSFAANAWSLHDMHGNVWEWCKDWYGPYGAGAHTDPTGPANGEYRVLRGGCWHSDPRALRSARRGSARGSYFPGQRVVGRGFRLVRLLPHEEAGPVQPPVQPTDAVLKEADEKLTEGKAMEAYKLLSDALLHGSRATRGDELKTRLSRLSGEILFSDKIYPPIAVVHQVRVGDSLFKIAKRYRTTIELIRRVNGLKGHSVRRGQDLKVVPGGFDVTVLRSDLRLTVTKNGTWVREFSIGLGGHRPIPVGEFVAGHKLREPFYLRENPPIPSTDKRNPLGTRWITVNEQYGIHGTWEPDTVGKETGKGCIRMQNVDVEWLFGLVVPGYSKITIRP